MFNCVWPDEQFNNYLWQTKQIHTKFRYFVSFTFVIQLYSNIDIVTNKTKKKKNNKNSNNMKCNKLLENCKNLIPMYCFPVSAMVSNPHSHHQKKFQF